MVRAGRRARSADSVGSSKYVEELIINYNDGLVMDCNDSDLFITISFDEISILIPRVFLIGSIAAILIASSRAWSCVSSGDN